MLPNRLLVRLFLLLLTTSIDETLAVSGFTRGGKQFSLAFPQIGLGPFRSIADVVLFTEEPTADVAIHSPESMTDKTTSWLLLKNVFLRKNKRARVFFNKDYMITSTGIYNVITLNATAPIQVTVNRLSNRGLWCESHIIFSETSCSRSYYVSTARHCPFLVVLTFRFDVKINVHFPKSARRFRFNVACNANRNCTSNSTTSLTLGKNKAWFLHIESKVDFQNTLIEADRPIFVFAGNILFKYESVKSVLLSSATGTETWGKEYIVPPFMHRISGSRERKVILRFNTKQLPFHYKRYDGFEVKNEKIEDYSKYVVYKNYDAPHIIKADDAFGLYQIIFCINDKGSVADTGFSNLVPTEQWIIGAIYYTVKTSNFDTIFNYIYTTADIKNVVVTGNGNYAAWASPVSVDGRKYNYGMLRISKTPATVYANEPNGRMVVYMIFRYFGKHSCNFLPADFYRGEIYNANCTPVIPVISDGVDNDCDGFVDEEWSNGKDDDGDGRVDEDYVETPGDSEWAVWDVGCILRCGSLRKEKKIRACKRNRFGTDCQGETMTCDPGTHCEEDWKNCFGSISIKCFCQDGCAKCNNDTHRCFVCKEGYFTGPYCLRACPEGWKGKGCSVGPKSLKDFKLSDVDRKKGKAQNSLNSNAPIIAILLSLSALYVASCFLFLPNVRRQEEYESLLKVKAQAKTRKNQKETTPGSIEQNSTTSRTSTR